MTDCVFLRLYAELNDYLPEELRKRRFAYAFDGPLTVGDLLVRLGIPADCVEIVLADGDSVGLCHALRDGDTLSCYPVFECFDVRTLLRLRREPLRHLRFFTAGGLHGLARYLRLCGFDTADCSVGGAWAMDKEAEPEGRVILFRPEFQVPGEGISRAWCVRAARPRRQLLEVLDALNLSDPIVPMGRCPVCNSPMDATAAPRRVCGMCGRTFGSQYVRRLSLLLKSLPVSNFTNDIEDGFV